MHGNSGDALCVFSNGDMISGEISIHVEKTNHYSDLVIMLEGKVLTSPIGETLLIFRLIQEQPQYSCSMK